MEPNNEKESVSKVGMTLEQAKDKAAQQANFSNWRAMLDYPAYSDRRMVELRTDEAAELYARSKEDFFKASLRLEIENETEFDGANCDTMVDEKGRVYLAKDDILFLLDSCKPLKQ